jgi:hypothetical protein
VDFFDSECRYFRSYGATASDGLTAKRSYFGNAERWESLTVMCPGSDALNVPVRQTVVRDCILTNPITNHGQGLSLYKSSWQNAVIEHNIFLDCSRAISIQSTGHNRTTPGVFRFANNLIVFDAPKETASNGQSTFAYNGPSGDQHLDDRQIVEIVSNAIVYNEDVVDPAVWSSPINMGLFRMWVSTVVVENNIAASMNAAKEEVEGAVFHLRSNNLLYRPSWGAAWGQTDLQTPNSYSAVFDFEELRPVGYAAYSASDGGPVGCRWDGEITMEDIRSLPDDWYERWPALELPDAVGTSFTWFGEDYR